MKTCATCKWWAVGKTESDYYHDPSQSCDCWPRLDGCDECNYDKGRNVCILTVGSGGCRSDTRDHPESKAHAMDGSDYKAVLLTSADFGCVQWEARPKGDNDDE